MTSNINSSISSQGINASQGQANSQQPNFPAPQPIAEIGNSLAERAVEVASDVLQTVRNGVIALLSPSSITCTPEEFKRLLSEGYQFPSKIIVTGSLTLSNSSLPTLPAGLKIRGSLDLRECTSLTALPAGLEIEVSLFLNGCTSLTALPAGLKIGRDLYLNGCTSLTALPAGLKIGRYLYLNGCTSLTALPAGLKIGSYLGLCGCTSLTALPAGLKIGGDVSFSRCTSLTALPAGLEIGGYLDLSECTSLTALPAGLEIGGDLLLRNCTSLTALPAGLKIGSSLSLSRCTSLTALPAGLEIGGYLDLSECTSLTALPAGLEIGGDLNLSRCRNLTSLPSWLTTLGARPDGYTREVHLIGTGLSDAIIERLRQTPTPGMQFNFSHAATAPTEEFPNLETALEFWLKETKDETLPIPNIVFARELEHANVMHFLARLTTTAEYKNLQTRQHLAVRISEVFNQISQDEALKGAACVLIHEGLISCDDRIISALEEIELMLLLDKIEKTDHTAEELKKLGKSFLLLEMVNAKAKAHKETLTWVDEIEIYLAFQIGLAERFNLPVKTRNMIFRGCAQVTDAQLKGFGDEIEQACTDEKLDAFLKTWSPWVKSQRQLVPSYEELGIADRELADDDICVFSQCAPDQPVFYNGHVYEYVDFVQQYRMNGTDPLDRSKIDISQLKRLMRNNNK